MGNIHSDYLSPSYSWLWINCPKSHYYQRNWFMTETRIQEPGNEYTEEGTNAHIVASDRLSFRLSLISDNCSFPRSRYRNFVETEEMQDGAKEYADYVAEKFRSFIEADPKSFVKVEHSVDVSEYAYNCFGTPDVYIVGANKIFVCDYKFGLIRVPVKENPQLMIYALGVLCTHSEVCESVDEITLSIYHPRVNKILKYHEWTISKEELLAWGNTKLANASFAVFNFNPRYSRGCAGEWCDNNFCIGRDYCPEYHQYLARYKIEYKMFNKEDTSRYMESVESATRWKNALDSITIEHPERTYSAPEELWDIIHDAEVAFKSFAHNTLAKCQSLPLIESSPKRCNSYDLFYATERGLYKLRSLQDVRRILYNINNYFGSFFPAPEVFYSSYGAGWVIIPYKMFDEKIFGEKSFSKALENVRYSIDGETYIFVKESLIKHYEEAENVYRHYLSCLKETYYSYKEFYDAFSKMKEEVQQNKKETKDTREKNNQYIHI